jgi:methionyl-tRNA formyltransferase
LGGDYDLLLGDIVAEEKISLDDKINYQELAEKLSKIGADLLVKTLKEIPKNTLIPTFQNDKKAVYAKKISKEDFLIDWNLPAQEINNKIRALNGCGSAYFILKEEKIKIHQAQVINEESSGYKAGEIIDNNLTIACKSGLLRPQILQKAGKNKVNIDEFLRGFKF